MKTITSLIVVSTGVLLMGLNVSNNKVEPAKPELLIKPERIYMQPPKLAPTCPSAEYNVALMNRNTETGSNGFPITEHCPQCNMGALYPQEGSKKCTYCESTFVLP